MYIIHLKSNWNRRIIKKKKNAIAFSIYFINWYYIPADVITLSGRNIFNTIKIQDGIFLYLYELSFYGICIFWDFDWIIVHIIIISQKVYMNATYGKHEKNKLLMKNNHVIYRTKEYLFFITHISKLLIFFSQFFSVFYS